MTKRNQLLQKGLFPETLPPCFDSTDLVRALGGKIRDLRSAKFNKRRSASYIRYNGTKHDGNRRPYSTPNPIPYFHVAEFISKNWEEITDKYNNSNYSVSSPKAAKETDDRAIKIASLSELAAKTSNQIRYAPYILKTDIAKFFPSIYTHTIPWVAHGIESSKSDTKYDSTGNRFNELDYHIQQCQRGQTRGVLIGPDAFRVVAEFIVADIDQQLEVDVGEKIIGAVRHVDDYYIGVESEIDAGIVLSKLRELLQNYDLHVNDSKTKVMMGLEPIDDLWAQKLRSIKLRGRGGLPPLPGLGFLNPIEIDKVNELLDSAFKISTETGTESPIKLALRKLDNAHCYEFDNWTELEPKLQRILHHYPHCIDYVLLLVVKRFALEETIDIEGWSKSAQILIQKNIGYNNHHELTWLLWFMFVCKLEIPETLIEKLSKMTNSHIRAILVAAYMKKLCPFKPNIKFPNKLETTDEDWLLNLVARSTGFTKAKFKGAFSHEFEHMALKKVKLFNFKKHIESVAVENSPAISKTKYGYDDEDFEENDELGGDQFDDDIDAQMADALRRDNT